MKIDKKIEDLGLDTISSIILGPPCINPHTIYPGNNMCQKWGRKSGLWVLHEIVNKTYAENMKKSWVH